MGCRRCDGLLLDEDECRRCVNCGHREFAEGEAMPKFVSEESRQKWIESVRRSKAKKKAERDGLVLADEAPKSRAVAVRPVVVEAVSGLDDKIAQLQADLAVLEQARDILSR